METFKIVMTSTFYPPFHLGGDAVHVKYLSEELATMGHEVHVVHSLDAYRLKRSGDPGEATAGPVHIHPYRSGLGRLGPMLTYATGSSGAAKRALEGLVSRERPDWIHHHNISLLGPGILSAAGKRPALYTAHDYWLICQRSDLLRNGKALCDESRCFSCALRSRRPYQYWRGFRLSPFLPNLEIVAPSRFMALTLEERAGLRSTVLENFVPRPGTTTIRPTERPYFLFASVHEAHKGLDILLRAFEGGGIASELHVVGEGSLSTSVAEASRRNAKIKKLGFIPRNALIDEMKNAQALLLPSTWYENSPLSCIEALSLGTPLIVSDLGGLPELVEDPACGIKTAPTSEGIAAAVRAVERDGPFRERMARNALQRYESRHTPEAYVSRYVSLATGSGKERN
jgi:glycosyltransferase involved in cell wall biosynthesis